MKFQKTLAYLLSDNFERSSQNYPIISSQNLPQLSVSTNCENCLVLYQINHLYGLNKEA
jgi:hypothetical protein